jgi:LytS/YehU family sensor histidine kinase
VSDSGVGLKPTGEGTGTGLTSLRERLRLMFGDDATLRISAREPRGVCAEVDLPVPARAA